MVIDMRRICRILWFSRHDMTEAQREALDFLIGMGYDDIEITKLDKTISSAYEIADEINQFDILAVVAPPTLQQQFIKVAEGRPVITALNDRVLVPAEDGTEQKVEFHFVKWEWIGGIEVHKKDFNRNTYEMIGQEYTEDEKIPDGIRKRLNLIFENLDRGMLEESDAYYALNAIEELLKTDDIVKNNK